MSARVVMIALDGADGALLDRWSVDGTLPHLRRLRDAGAESRLTAPAGITDDGLWASFQYAAGLGVHGRYHWVQRSPTGKMRPSHLDDPDLDAFWVTLSKLGQRVAVIDIPKCGRPRPVNGIHLSDWLVHGRSFGAPQSYPEPLAGEVLEAFGAPPPSRCGYEVPALTDDEVREVRTHLQTSIAQKRAAGLHYLMADAWDLFMIGFKEAHCGGHHLWDLADPSHPEYDAARAESLRYPLKALYQELDAAVGDVVAAAGEGAHIVVFTPTDMEPNATLTHLMPEVIHRVNRQLDSRRWVQAVQSAAKGISRLVGGRQLLSASCEILPYNENCTALRVHSRRDERLRLQRIHQIEAWLRELTDADTGQPVVAAIDRPSRECAGAESARLPDLLVRYPAGTVPRAVTSPRLGTIEAERPDMRPGDHAAGGFLISSAGHARDVSRVQDIGGFMADLLLGPGRVLSVMSNA